MNFTFNLVVESFRDPNVAAQRVLAIKHDLNLSISAYALSIIISIVTLFGFNGFQLVNILPGSTPLSPFILVAVMGMANLVVIYFVMLIGRGFGGNGQLIDGIWIFSWLQVLQIIIQIGQMVLMLVSVSLATFLSLMASVVWLWVMFGFVTVWLGLHSKLISALCFLIAIFGLSIGFSILLVFFGFNPEAIAS